MGHEGRTNLIQHLPALILTPFFTRLSEKSRNNSVADKSVQAGQNSYLVSLSNMKFHLWFALKYPGKECNTQVICNAHIKREGGKKSHLN